MKRVALLLFIVGLGTGFATCQNTSRETRDVKNFSRINFGIAGNLTIKTGTDFSVVLEGESRDLEEVLTEVSGDKLVIKQDSWRFRFNNKVNVYITMPALKGLGVSGSGNAEIADAVNSSNLDLSVSGSGKLKTSDLDVENLDCSISGSGNITLGSGNAKNADISISGSGNFSGYDVEVKSLDIRVSGSGSCTCYVTDALDASISGSGNVSYKGNPRIDARVSGSGHVRSAR
jgi:hypothetical protein